MAVKQKILIVDDDANIAELISLYLLKECYDTKIVEDGESALREFKTYQPNLILLDLMLPGIDGYQVCREIRTQSNVPIIMLSAKGEVFDKVLGVELLHETNVDALLEHCNEIEDDRAVLRALHFFGETSRVEDAADAIHHNDYDKFLELIDESGKSSWELLQNCYTMKDFHEQKITRTLALTQLFLKKIGAGVCRVHGGGFAGVIAAIVPEKEQDNYVEYISRFVGKENVYPMDIRAIGAVHIG